jgi:hypothetical protein
VTPGKGGQNVMGVPVFDTAGSGPGTRANRYFCAQWLDRQPPRNLQRKGGFKGFNQHSVSLIIAETDPRKQPGTTGARYTLQSMTNS